MTKVRVISRLDIKNEFVIKGIQLEGLRRIGDPNQIAKVYYKNSIDEIVLMDAVAAYYDRNTLGEILNQTCRDVFVPITVGGGIRSLHDATTALDSGADKVAINTGAIERPELISDMANVLGNQSVVLSIEARNVAENHWMAFTNNGREPSGLDVVEWAKRAETLGVGEILLTSVDRDGTKRGFDSNLYKAVCRDVSVPVIASGGAGSIEHIVDVCKIAPISGVAVGTLFHYGNANVVEVKERLENHGVKVRRWQ